MANYSTNEFRSGLRIIIDNDPCVIVDNEFVKPGKKEQAWQVDGITGANQHFNDLDVLEVTEVRNHNVDSL